MYEVKRKTDSEHHREREEEKKNVEAYETRSYKLMPNLSCFEMSLSWNCPKNDKSRPVNEPEEKWITKKTLGNDWKAMEVLQEAFFPFFQVIEFGRHWNTRLVDTGHAEWKNVVLHFQIYIVRQK